MEQVKYSHKLMVGECCLRIFEGSYATNISVCIGLNGSNSYKTKYGLSIYTNDLPELIGLLNGDDNGLILNSKHEKFHKIIYQILSNNIKKYSTNSVIWNW